MWTCQNSDTEHPCSCSTMSHTNEEAWETSHTDPQRLGYHNRSAFFTQSEMPHSERRISHLDGITENPFVMKKCQLFAERNFQKMFLGKWSQSLQNLNHPGCQLLGSQRCCDPRSWGAINSERLGMCHLRSWAYQGALEQEKPGSWAGLAGRKHQLLYRQHFFFFCRKYLSAYFHQNLILRNPNSDTTKSPWLWQMWTSVGGWRSTS